MIYLISNIVSEITKNIFYIYVIFVLLIYLFKNKRIFFNNLFNFLLIIFFIISLTPLSQILLKFYEAQHSNGLKNLKKIDGILILSGNHDTQYYLNTGNFKLNETGKRILGGIDIHNKYPYAKIIFSGNSNHMSEKLKDNKDIKDYFRKLGYTKQNNIIYELKSRNTFENLIFSKELVKPSKEEHWVVVTSAYHMPRVVKISSKINWEIHPYSVDYKIDKIKFLSNKNWQYLSTFLREFFAHVQYRLLSRI
tara:strand:+ start:350 stop:1102 length:753 start_codon:yes stop_codon:yes gene_type:complete